MFLGNFAVNTPQNVETQQPNPSLVNSLSTNPWIQIGLGILANQRPSLVPQSPLSGIAAGAQSGLMNAEKMQQLEAAGQYKNNMLALKQQQINLTAELEKLQLMAKNKQNQTTNNWRQDQLNALIQDRKDKLNQANARLAELEHYHGAMIGVAQQNAQTAKERAAAMKAKNKTFTPQLVKWIDPTTQQVSYVDMNKPDDVKAAIAAGLKQAPKDLPTEQQYLLTNTAAALRGGLFGTPPTPEQMNKIKQGLENNYREIVGTGSNDPVVNTSVNIAAQAAQIGATKQDIIQHLQNDKRFTPEQRNKIIQILRQKGIL